MLWSPAHLCHGWLLLKLLLSLMCGQAGSGTPGGGSGLGSGGSEKGFMRGSGRGGSPSQLRSEAGGGAAHKGSKAGVNGGVRNAAGWGVGCRRRGKLGSGGKKGGKLDGQAGIGKGGTAGPAPGRWSISGVPGTGTACPSLWAGGAPGGVRGGEKMEVAAPGGQSGVRGAAAPPGQSGVSGAPDPEAVADVKSGVPGLGVVGATCPSGVLASEISEDTSSASKPWQLYAGST